MPRLDRTWIVVMDSGQARIFSIVKGADGRELKPALPPLKSALHGHARDERSDKPGRSAASARDGLRHAIEPKHDFHKLAKRAFVKDVATTLGAARREDKFDRLVLIAPRRSLGELHTLLAPAVKSSVAQEIGKDFAKLSTKALSSRLMELLVP